MTTPTPLVDEKLYTKLYLAAEESLPYIEKHPYGKPIAASVRRALQAIVAAKIESAKQSEQPENGWKPLDSAPKDGRYILLCRDKYNAIPIIAFWHIYTNVPCWRCGHMDVDTRYYTVWQPLPPSPQAEE